MKRPNWDWYFVSLAVAVGARSTCSRLTVGAVVVSADNRVVSTGYNGVPASSAHCIHADEQPCRRAIHAEANALPAGLFVTPGHTIYVTHSPCTECQHRIVVAGVDRVVFRQFYRNGDLTALTDFGVTVQHYKGELSESARLPK